MNNPTPGMQMDRRGFLLAAGAAALGAGLSPVVGRAQPADVLGADLATPSGKPLRGLFPILETPFRSDNTLDTDALAAEVDYCNRGRLGGMIWPVFASSWSTLSDAERIAGAETILTAARGGRAMVAIAVQNNAWDTATSVRYARHAAAHGADAIVSIPPNNGWNVADQAVIDYYKAIAAATDLPLIVQTRGTISVDLMVRLFEAIPTMKATKDEVGDPLQRVGELIRRTGNKLAVWAAGGGSGDFLLQELPLGFVGLCPTPQYADLLQQVMELYWAGRKREAFDMYGRVQAFATIPGATEYMLIARGVFPEGTRNRPQPMEPEARRTGGMGAGRGRAGPPTPAQKRFIRAAIEEYLRPYFRA